MGVEITHTRQLKVWNQREVCVIKPYSCSVQETKKNMAVPRRNGFDEDDDDENILFDEDENGIELDGEQDQLEYESEQEDFDATPPHLREMAIAIQEGNTNDFLSGLGYSTSTL